MSARFTITLTAIEGVRVIERQRIGDARGFLERLFCADELAAAGWVWPIAQINRTLTPVPGTLRGLHYQRPPAAEAKFVTCVHGAVLDVALDLRAGSPTFGRHHTEILSGENRCALLIPPGCAHGFQVIEAGAELIYIHSAAYAPAHEGGVDARDPALAIAWPIADPILSDRDRGHPPLSATEATTL